MLPRRHLVMNNMEKMDDFFTARVDGYDAHMLANVTGCKEGYQRMAALLPDDAAVLLDLGCGTGLELDEIFRCKPDIAVTGIDLTKSMLDKLREKHPGKNMRLIHGSYFDCDFGKSAFDAAVSFQTLHHFTHATKLELYRRVCDALKPGGVYIECDYMVLAQAEEDFLLAENRRIRRELSIPDDAFYHYDTPCTIDNQLRLLAEAGFAPVQLIWREGNTTIIVAQK